MNIGWIELGSCKRGFNPLKYHKDYTVTELMHIAQQAITAQIGPSSNIPGFMMTVDDTMTADLCSNPIFALNNGYEMSYHLDMSTSPPVIAGYSDSNDWIGTDIAKDLLVNSCSLTDIGEEALPLMNSTYYACGNSNGM